MGQRTVLTIFATFALVLGACSSGTSTDASGAEEGIQIHGSWVIDIYNADGTLDQHLEFENALQTSGESTVAQLLAGTNSSGEWVIYAQEVDEALSPCTNVDGSGSRCIITESGTPSDRIFPNLTVSTSGGQVVLAGSFVATKTGAIAEVSTALGTCSNTVAPIACSSQTTNFFTSKTLSSGSAISPGQQVQIEVTLSFS